MSPEISGSFVNRILGGSVLQALNMGMQRQEVINRLLPMGSVLPSPVVNGGFTKAENPVSSEGFTKAGYMPREAVMKAIEGIGRPVVGGFTRARNISQPMVTKELTDEQKKQTIMSSNPSDFATAEEYVASKGDHLKQQIAQRNKLENQVPRLISELKKEGISVSTDKGGDARINSLEILKDGEPVDYGSLSRSGKALVDITQELDKLDQTITILGANKSQLTAEFNAANKIPATKADDILYLKLSDREYSDLMNEYKQEIFGVSDKGRSSGGGIQGKVTKKGFIEWLNSDKAIEGYEDVAHIALVNKARELINAAKGKK
jgi:hypothetical protein